MGWPRVGDNLTFNEDDPQPKSKARTDQTKRQPETNEKRADANESPASTDQLTPEEEEYCKSFRWRPEEYRQRKKEMELRVSPTGEPHAHFVVPLPQTDAKGRPWLRPANATTSPEAQPGSPTQAEAGSKIATAAATVSPSPKTSDPPQPEEHPLELRAERIDHDEKPLREEPAEGQRRAVANVFRCERDIWTISCEGVTIQQKYLKGLEYIAILIRNAGSQIAATQVEAFSRAKRPGILPGGNFHDTGVDSFTGAYIPEETIDQKARQQYEQRARELADLIQDARQRGESERADELTRELETIEDSLKAATGRGGGRRKVRGDSEKARVRVTNAIRHALEKLSECAPKTAAQLRNNIETGASMMYRDASTLWKL